MIPARGLVVLKPVQTQETLAGGSIVLLESTRERWTGQQAEVVQVGAEMVCEDEDCERLHYWTFIHGHKDSVPFHPCPLAPGDWVIVEPRLFAELEDNMWIAPQDAVLARIKMTNDP